MLFIFLKTHLLLSPFMEAGRVYHLLLLPDIIQEETEWDFHSHKAFTDRHSIYLLPWDLTASLK